MASNDVKQLREDPDFKVLVWLLKNQDPDRIKQFMKELKVKQNVSARGNAESICESVCLERGRQERE